MNVLGPDNMIPYSLGQWENAIEYAKEGNRLRQDLRDEYAILPSLLNAEKYEFQNQVDSSFRDPTHIHKEEAEWHIGMLTGFQKSKPKLYGLSSPMRRALEEVQRHAMNDLPVLILGETGTGKELIAESIHKRSKRACKPFVPINCSGIPTSLLQSLLFGIEPGQATDVPESEGMLKEADGGTVFLDEIGDMPPSLQAQILRFLNDKVVVKVGPRHMSTTLDVRIIAATNKGIDVEWRRGQLGFRDDLYYRLNAVRIYLQPLRERVVDIPFLCYRFISDYNGCVEDDRKVDNILVSTFYWLITNRWPGNVRELKAAIDNLCTNAEKGGIRTFSYVPPHAPAGEIRPFIARIEEQFDLGDPENFLNTWLGLDQLRFMGLADFFDKIGKARRAEYRQPTATTTQEDNRDDKRSSSFETEFYKHLTEMTFDELVREYCTHLVKKCGGNKAKAARQADLPETTFKHKLNKKGAS